MDIRQLKAFVAVFEERNITRAAARLCLTQPTLSVTIRQLEEELATPLFGREARGMAVSEAARRLYPQAQQLLAQMAQLKTQFVTPNHCLPLSLGVEADLGQQQLASLLKHCKKELPYLLLTVLPGCCGDLRLASEELRCENELLLPLWEERFVLTLPADQTPPPEEMPPLAATQLDWVVCPTHPTHQRLLGWLGGSGTALSGAHQAGSLTLAREMVMAGLGAALLPPSLLTPGMVAVPLADAAPTRRVGLCYAANALAHPAIASLLDSLQSWPQQSTD